MDKDKKKRQMFRKRDIMEKYYSDIQGRDKGRFSDKRQSEGGKEGETNEVARDLDEVGRKGKETTGSTEKRAKKNEIKRDERYKTIEIEMNVKKTREKKDEKRDMESGSEEKK